MSSAAETNFYGGLPMLRENISVDLVKLCRNLHVKDLEDSLKDLRDLNDLRLFVYVLYQKNVGSWATPTDSL